MPDYTPLAPEVDTLAALRVEGEFTHAFIAGIPESEAGTVHAPYSWTVRQVVGHLIDTERILGYRTLRIARGDATELPGFDENAYADAASGDTHALAELAAEFAAVRSSHLSLLGHLGADAWGRGGLVSGRAMTVRDLARTILGHERHHLAILRRRLAATGVAGAGPV